MAIVDPVVVARALYLYENAAVWAFGVSARSLYLDANRAIWATAVDNRTQYLYENRAIWAQSPLARANYLYLAKRDGEVEPWLMRLSPTEQVQGGQVSLYGDGLGSIVEVGAEVSVVITADSTNGGNLPAFMTDRGGAEWISNGGAGAWVRFTFAQPETIVALSLEDAATGDWGTPEFRFSDALGNVTGAGAVANPDPQAEYPVGLSRTLYTLPAPRLTTYVEIRVAGGGGGTQRGLRDVWVYADRDTAAEASATFLVGGNMGIVSWQNRSPGLYPANGGQPITPAAVVTVPADAVSGMVRVVEST